MKAGVGLVRLEDISGGTLGAGSIPFERILSEVVSAQNGSLVNVLSSTTEIVELTLTDMLEGELALLYYKASISKGGTSGKTNVALTAAGGSGSILLNEQSGLIYNVYQQDASVTVAYFGAAIIRCTLAGSPIVELAASSGGSDGTVAVGQGKLLVARLALN